MPSDPDPARSPEADAGLESLLKSALLLDVAHRVALVARLLKSLPASEAEKLTSRSAVRGQATDRPDGTSGAVRSRADRRPVVSWADLGARFYSLRELFSGDGHKKSAKAQVLTLEMVKILNEIGREHGVSMSVAVAMPEMYLRLLDPFLAGSPAPLVEKQRAAIENMRQAAMQEWKRPREIDPDRTELVDYQKLRVISAKVEEQCAAVLTEDQRKESAVLNPLIERKRRLDSRWKSSGARVQVHRDLTTQWLRDLSLGEPQRRLLEPIVHEYMAGIEALPVDEETRSAALLDFMILMQQRIRSAIPLDDTQTRRLKSWHEWYEFSIEESVSGGPPA